MRRSPLFTAVAEELVLFNGARNHYGNNSGGNMLSFAMYEDFRDNFVDRGNASALSRINGTVPNPAPGAENLHRNVRASGDGHEHRRRRADVG
jgi:hypothetical protein